MSAVNDLISAAPGMIFEHAGFDEPAGFKWSNGQALGRTAYPRLFSALTKQVTGTISNASTSITGVSADLTGVASIGMPIGGTNVPAGTTIAAITASTITLSAAATGSGSVTLTIAPHGIGDGSTTFNVPDRRGRVGVGRDNMGGTAASRVTNSGTGNPGINGALLGGAGGVDRVTLTTAQMPAHNHNVTDPGHGHTSNALQNNVNYSATGGATGTPSPVTATINSASTGITIQNNGSGNAHPIMPPSYVCNYVIKT